MKVYIEKVLTGHTHVGSPYETASDCGNCDGASCHRCEPAYKLYDMETDRFLGYYDSFEEAEKKKRELEKGEP